MFESILHIRPEWATQDEYLELIFCLLEASKQYYEYSKSIISDEEFDYWFVTLKRIEELHPERIVENSPTQNLQHQASKIDAFQKATHEIPLLSLENTYNADDIGDRNDSIVRMMDKMDIKTSLYYIIEPKFDGISVELIYKEGKLVQAITRWDGYVGEDITHNVLQIQWVPKSINYTEDLHVRWEIVMPKSAFELLNTERSQQWEPLFANPRNAASGTIKQLDSSIVAQRWLICYVYDVL